MDEHQPANDAGSEDPDASRGDDYEYDEAHDNPSGPVDTGSAERPVLPPAMDFGSGGDYGYDEAHDLGTR
jgi:hypothetical protein